ncbi:MAG: major capsid protein [Microviridae sp.]|nr:MAG: major capsid protein [Microviridae sp.]
MRKRNKFSLSYQRLLSCRMGQLIPIGLTEVLPNDTIQHATTGLVRCAPLVSPVMARCDVRIHHFYVPTRILWSSWEDFITGGPDGADDSVLPTVNSGASGFAEGSLADYFGLPTGVPNLEVSALPFRAYNLIFNEYYRDEDLIDPVRIGTEDGPDTVTNLQLLNCAWEKDYFTSARPWTQKGSAVSIPVFGDNVPVNTTISSNGSLKLDIGTSTTLDSLTFGTKSGGVYSNAQLGVTSGYNTIYKSGLKATSSIDTSAAAATGINVSDLRLALSLQRFQEARARYGSRYTEYLRYLGVISSDARLQRPEYLAGGRSPLQFSEVLQTAQGSNPVGTMAGHGLTALRSNRYRRFIEEHGYIVTLMSIRPKTVYKDMIPRTWLRRTKEDYFQPEFQHIGQQEVYNKELNANSANPDGVFGYQDRYNEYRYHESSVSGEFRSILNYWHMARDFAGDVALNGDFITCNPTDRIFAAPGTSSDKNDTIYCFFNHSIQARRAMVKVANPKII